MVAAVQPPLAQLIKGDIGTLDEDCDAVGGGSRISACLSQCRLTWLRECVALLDPRGHSGSLAHRDDQPVGRSHRTLG